MDRLNDVEAAIAKVARLAGSEPDLATSLTMQSLESRREMLREELAEISKSAFVDVCDYRLIPNSGADYALLAVTAAWRDFQEILSLVFSSVKRGEPRATAKLSQDVIDQTQLNFGYAYAGSLGVVLTVPNDRYLLAETDLDKAVAAVFRVLKSDQAEKILEVKHSFGVPVIKKLYSLAKVHSQYGMGADIKWVRDNRVVREVRNQPAEFAEICRLIEDKSDTESDDMLVHGMLLAWNTKTRTFVLELDDKLGQITGRWAEDFDGDEQRTVPAYYRVELTKKTTVQYAEEKDIVVWLLRSMKEVGPSRLD